MPNASIATTARRTSTLRTSKLLRNTYLLLAMTLAVSAVTAWWAMVSQARPLPWLLVMAVFIGGPFLINALRHSAWSLPATFVFTGFMGYVLGPVVGYYLHLPNGPLVVTTALALTAGTFVGLSAYALVTRRDFSFMGGFLMAGLIVVLLAIVANIFLDIPALSLTISAVSVLLMAGLILFDTSRMVHGGEDNYVMMTVSLYANIYVLFTHLLNLLGALEGD